MSEGTGAQDERRSVKEVATELYRAQLRSFLDTGARLRWPVADAPTISVILVLFNRAELTLRCLRSLTENAPGPLEVILVDNASTDETPDLLDRLDGARVIRNYENRGFLLAVNQAARRARGEYLLLLNNDAELLPGALEAALETFSRAADVGAVGGRILLLDGRLQEAGSIVWSDGSALGYGRGDAPDAPAYMFTRDVDYCSGAFLMTPRALFRELGGFDERYRPCYYEEVDYCFRVRASGRRIVYEPRVTIAHYEFGSSRDMATATRMQQERRAAFVRAHEAALAAQHAPEAGRVLLARQRPPRGRRVLVLDDRVPHEHLGSGFPRARRMLHALVGQGHAVTFYPLTQPTEAWDDVYQDIPREVEVMTGLGPHGLASFLRERRGHYDALLVSRPHNMSLFRRLLGASRDGVDAIPLVYDAEAVFALRDVAQRRIRGEAVTEGEKAALVQEEASLAVGASAVLTVSPAERRVFEAAGAEHVFVLGHAVALTPGAQAFDRRRGLLAVGGVYRDTDPNADALRWFTTEILPRVRAEIGADVPFRWVGTNHSERLTGLLGPGVEVLGRVDELEPVYGAARVFVAPTRYCAGLPLKVYQAAAHGLPCVATSLVAEQLGWEPGVDLLVADTPEDLARHCIRLHTDAGVWARVREAALTRVAQDGSESRFAQTLAEALATAEEAARRPRRNRA